MGPRRLVCTAHRGFVPGQRTSVVLLRLLSGPAAATSATAATTTVTVVLRLSLACWSGLWVYTILKTDGLFLPLLEFASSEPFQRDAANTYKQKDIKKSPTRKGFVAHLDSTRSYSGPPDSYWDPDGGARKRRVRDFGLRWLTVQ